MSRTRPGAPGGFRRRSLTAASGGTLVLGGALVLAAALALAAAGCGGGGGGKKTAPAANEQKVAAAGSSFAAPAGWKVTSSGRATTVTGPGSLLLSLAIYKLVKPYAPARFAAATRELDSVAARLAVGRKGTVASRATVTVAGEKARSYLIAYVHDGHRLTQQVTFVLRGSTEWLLVCRRSVSDPQLPCSRLLSSFTLPAAG